MSNPSISSLKSNMDASVLARIEQQRIELEQNIAKLRKSLRHWQTLELDYEGLKEEFQTLPPDTSREECLQIGRDFKAIVVDEKDLQSLLNDAKSGTRRPLQVAELLAKRVEYVSRNVETVRKQLSEAEKKRNALLLAEEPEHRDEAGLPLVEVIEELDDEGLVISSKLQEPATEAPQLIDVLKKAGVSGIEENDGMIRKAEEPASDVATVASTRDASVQDGDERRAGMLSSTMSAGPMEARSKSVETSSSLFSTNPDDTEEDAALRQEMQEYGLDEVGAIVAELEMEEGSSDVEYNEDEQNLDIDSDFDDDFEEEDEESEDETGMAKNPTITSKYHRQMEELQKKLGLKDFTNLGPTPDLASEVQPPLNRPSPAEAARKAALARHGAAERASIDVKVQNIERVHPKKAKKKKVAFAESLDIASEPDQSDPKSSKGPPLSEQAINPVGETIIERPEATDPDMTPASPPKPAPKPLTTKISKFKSTRQSMHQTPKHPPPAALASHPPPTHSPQQPAPILSPTLIENSPPSASSASTLVPAPDPDDIDPNLHRAQIAAEHHKLRNRRIHAQGGFVGQGEEDNFGEEMAPELVQGEDGNVRKVSRFKAARLKAEN